MSDRAEREELRAQSDEFHDLTPMGWFTVDGQGLIVEANPAGAAMLGLPASELAGKRFDSLALPDDREGFTLHLEKLLRKGGRQNFELRVKHAGGPDQWLDLHAWIAPGACRFVRIAALDITDLRRQDEERELAEQFAALLTPPVISG